MHTDKAVLRFLNTPSLTPDCSPTYHCTGHVTPLEKAGSPGLCACSVRGAWYRVEAAGRWARGAGMAAEAGTLDEFEGVPTRGRGRDNMPGDGGGVGGGGGGGDAAPLSTMNATLRDMCERVRGQLNELQGEYGKWENATSSLFSAFPFPAAPSPPTHPAHAPRRHRATTMARRHTHPTAPHAVIVSVQLEESVVHLGRHCSMQCHRPSASFGCRTF